MKRIERGWAGHFCMGVECNWRHDQALTDSMYWYGIHIERMSGYEDSDVR